METVIHFSADEERALEKIFALYTERAKHSITISYVMDKWSRFVTEVEDGYRLTIDDYTNDLTRRDFIQNVLNICPANVDLKEWAAGWDERFVLATQTVNEPLLPSLDDERPDWWWFRMPVRPGERVQEWLRLYGAG